MVRRCDATSGNGLCAAALSWWWEPSTASPLARLRSSTPPRCVSCPSRNLAAACGAIDGGFALLRTNFESSLLKMLVVARFKPAVRHCCGSFVDRAAHHTASTHPSARCAEFAVMLIVCYARTNSGACSKPHR